MWTPREPASAAKVLAVFADGGEEYQVGSNQGNGRVSGEQGEAVNDYEGDRRRELRVTARYEARVEVGTALLDREIGTGSLGPLTLYGHTHDLSPSGLGVIIPAVDVGPRHSGEALPARVKVGLPEGGVEVEAEAVHWGPLGELGLGSGVLLGVKFTGGGEALAKLLHGTQNSADERR